MKVKGEQDTFLCTAHRVISGVPGHAVIVRLNNKYVILAFIFCQAGIFLRLISLCNKIMFMGSQLT